MNRPVELIDNAIQLMMETEPEEIRTLLLTASYNDKDVLRGLLKKSIEIAQSNRSLFLAKEIDYLEMKEEHEKIVAALANDINLLKKENSLITNQNKLLNQQNDFLRSENARLIQLIQEKEGMEDGNGNI